MRINAVSNVSVYPKNKVSKVDSNNNRMNHGLKVVSLSEYMASPVSFRGRNNEQAIFYGAEVAPYSKAGGVGVVMKDYGFLLDPKDEVVVSPYYRADVDKKTGVVSPAKDADGDYILHTNGGDLKLDLVKEKNMQWGNRKDNKIMLFNLRDEKDKVHYFVFDDATAHYTKPYEGGTVYASGSKSATNAWNGDPYAKNSKAFVELLPDLIASKKDFNPATVVCSDSQTAYTHEYVAQKALKDKDYSEIKTTHVGHNLGPGYCGETSMQNMFVNLGATPEQISKIEKDPIFRDKILGDKYFEPFVKETLDETGTSSATQIALHYADKNRAGGEGFVKSFSVVAEDYAKSIAENPQTAYNIHNTAKKLYDQGVFNGILNPLEDASIDAAKPLPNPRYNEDCIDTDGTVYPAFEIYPENASYSEMREIKTRNKIKFLERLSAQDNTIITGDKSRKASVNPEAKGVYDGPAIRPDLIEKLKNGEDVPMFVSWGRIDTQKGHDISLGAFEKFAKTPEGKNAVFVLGAGLDKSDESKRVEKKITEMLKDPDLQGRIIHIDGWAPAYAMASAADAAVFTSRFEPCGLTDIEAMKYFCTPIVTNTQGFKQKNFDPRIEAEAEKATSYKTEHEFDLLKEQVDLIIKAYVDCDESALAKVKAEFPIFASVDENGNAVYDDTAFQTFAQEYSEFIDARKKDLELSSPDGKLPEKWNDWDELSKEYSFKYTGFARDLKDAILKAETAKAISACVSEDEQTKAMMFDNLKALNTGWKGNASLHPSNESSYDMYKRLHMSAPYSAPVKEDIISKDDDFIDDQIEKRQKTDIEKRVGTYTLGALTGLSAVLLNVFKKNGIKTTEADLKAKVEELTKQLASQEELQNEVKALTEKLSKLTSAGRRNVIIAGVLGAAGAAVATLLAVKFYKKNNDKKDVKTEKPAQTSDIAQSKENTEADSQKAAAQTPVSSENVSTPLKEKSLASAPEENGLFSNFAKYV